MDGILTSLMKSLAMRMPFLLVCIAGLALVAIRWRRHPRASLLALLGVVALFPRWGRFSPTRLCRDG
ncbi:MAG: hypothetical protein ABR527_01200 [Gemmatimonadota bacterium]